MTANLDNRQSRSSFLSILSRAGVGTVAAVAGVVTAPRGHAKARVEPGRRLPATHRDCFPSRDCVPVGCCCLACEPGGCPGSGANHTCPSGFNKKRWTCCDGSAGTRACSECTTADNCYQSHFACSETYIIYPGAC